MTTQINGDTGVSQCQPNSVSQDDLQSGVVGKGAAVFTQFSGTTVDPTVSTPLTLNVPVFDTNNCMNVTNGRYTPNIAGYYQCNAEVDSGGNSVGGLECRLVRNTDLYARFAFGATDTTGYKVAACSGVVYMNGTTDFIEVNAYCASGAFTATGRFSAALVRAA